MNNKKILYLRTDICEVQINTGGSIGHTQGVLEGFDHQKYELTVFSSQMYATLEKQKNIIFYPLRVLSIFYLVRWRFWYLRWRLESFFSTFFFFFQVLYQTQQQFDVIYQRYSILNATGLLLKWYKKIPLILEYNGSEAYWFDVPSNDVWYRRWFAFKKLSYWVERLNVQHADTIVVVSQALKDDLELKGVDCSKILMNPNGVNQDVFDKVCLMEKRNGIRELYGLQDAFVFGFIGTFGHWHGIEVLQHIIPQVCKENSRAKFLLMGDGHLKVQIESALHQEIAEGKVIFTGRIDQHKAPEYLAACDAFLCPTQPNADGTRFFGSPTKLFEYLSMAKPVIASDLEQLGDIISPAIHVSSSVKMNSVFVSSEIGILVDPLDWQGFIDACLLCLSFPKADREKIGNNARVMVLNKYTWTKHVERIVERLNEL